MILRKTESSQLSKNWIASIALKCPISSDWAVVYSHLKYTDFLQ